MANASATTTTTSEEDRNMRLLGSAVGVAIDTVYFSGIGAVVGGLIALNLHVNNPVVHCSRRTYARRLRVAAARNAKRVFRAYRPRGWTAVGHNMLAFAAMGATQSTMKEVRGEDDLWNWVPAVVPGAAIISAGRGHQVIMTTAWKLMLGAGFGGVIGKLIKQSTSGSPDTMEEEIS